MNRLFLFALTHIVWVEIMRCRTREAAIIGVAGVPGQKTPITAASFA